MFLASFRIGDGPLLEALYEAVDRLRGGVYVVTSWDAEALRKGFAGLGDDEKLTEDEIKVQDKRFDDMTRRGSRCAGIRAATPSSSWSTTPWPWSPAPTCAVTADEPDWRGFAEAAGEAPVLYEATDSGPVTLYAGDGQWTLQRSGGTWRLRAAAAPAGRGAGPVDRMGYWTRPGPGTAAPDPKLCRGFITATLRRA